MWSRRTFTLSLWFVIVAVTSASPVLTYAKGGGSSAGGGNLDDEPPVFISRSQIAQTVAQSRLAIETTLRNVQIRLTLGQAWTKPEQDAAGYTELKNLFSRFFTSDRDVYQVLSQVKINLQESEACKDPFSGRPQDDGSVSGTGDEICISAYTLGQKLVLNPFCPDAYQPRLMALVFHEVAHLFGANEQEAVAIQSRVLEVNKNRAIVTPNDFAEFLDPARTEQIKNILRGWIEQITNRNYAFLGEELGAAGKLGMREDFLEQSWSVARFIQSAVVPYWPYLFRYDGEKALLSEVEYELLDQVARRIRAIWAYNYHVGYCQISGREAEATCSNPTSVEYITPFNVVQSDTLPVYEWFLINDSRGDWKKGLWLYPNVKLMMKKYQSIDDSIADIQDTISKIDDLWPKLRQRVANPNFQVIHKP